MHPGVFADITPDKAAVIMAGSGETVTYAQLDQRADRVSQLFVSLGLLAGDHIAFQVGNRPVFFDIMWGAHRAGLIYTAMSTRLGPEETAYIVANCDAVVVIADADQTGTLEALGPGGKADTPLLRARYVLGGAAPGWDRWDEALGSVPASPVDNTISGDDMLYSSGTTGRPKGVYRKLTDATLETPDGVTAMCELVYGYSAETVYLSPAPLYHAAPLRFTRSVHRTGGTVVVMEHFEPALYLDLVTRHRVTHSQVVPTMFIRILKLPDEVRAAADVTSLRAVVHAAAPCPVPVKRRMIEWWGPIIWEYYAGTEGNGIVLCGSEEWLRHPGTVGRPIGSEVHVLDDAGTEVPTGQPGTIYFGGGQDFEYHGDPTKTSEAHSPQGWGTLGDVGYVDADGYLFLTDRKANMIISGGVNIYPQEAENLLALHPKVADVAVFGVPDEEMGEQVKAVVQPAAGEEPGPVLEAELIAYCRDNLAHLKCPRSVDFEAELPRHPTGKLYKRLLKDRYWEGRPTHI